MSCNVLFQRYKGFIKKHVNANFECKLSASSVGKILRLTRK